MRRGLDRTIRKDIGIRLGGALSPSDAWLFLHEIKMAGLHSRGSPIPVQRDRCESPDMTQSLDRRKRITGHAYAVPVVRELPLPQSVVAGPSTW